MEPDSTFRNCWSWILKGCESSAIKDPSKSAVFTMYREKEVVKRNVPSEHAVDELIGLIKEHGMWVEAEVV